MLNEIRRSIRPALSTVKFQVRDFGLYLRHIVTRTSYAEYYADRMDRHIRRRPNWGLLIDRTFQVEYLKKQGLTPESKLLDYGCGAVAAGRHMIEFLNLGKYTGFDVSSEAIKEGTKRIEAAGLTAKSPRLFQIPGGDLTAVPKETFDFIWSYSVLTHMPADDIETLLKNIQRFMHTGSAFYADFALSPKGISHRRFKDWYYPLSFFTELAKRTGLTCELQTDWKSPEDPDGNDTMVKFMLAVRT